MSGGDDSAARARRGGRAQRRVAKLVLGVDADAAVVDERAHGVDGAVARGDPDVRLGRLGRRRRQLHHCHVGDVRYGRGDASTRRRSLVQWHHDGPWAVGPGPWNTALEHGPRECRRWWPRRRGRVRQRCPWSGPRRMTDRRVASTPVGDARAVSRGVCTTVHVPNATLRRRTAAVGARQQSCGEGRVHAPPPPGPTRRSPTRSPRVRCGPARRRARDEVIIRNVATRRVCARSTPSAAMAPTTETEELMAWIALPFAILGMGASIYGVRGHLKNYTKPEFQRCAWGASAHACTRPHTPTRSRPGGTARTARTARWATRAAPQLRRPHPSHDSRLRERYAGYGPRPPAPA